ncbi:unnamed protein product [Cylicostephanus goldi]|uniref:Elongation Factor G domain-containing protein n=1 Tax=Cylicostephanus goldi TaxID=71465 RepID=A0A3P6S897_CYLGO|nr:unnamed protein product [Cylicostephanus goldi]
MYYLLEPTLSIVISGLVNCRDEVLVMVTSSGIDSPDPVYFCCIEPPTTKSNLEFERALNEIAVEDPSLRVRFDHETGQTIVETMGELHLDIVKNRLVRDYGLNVFVGPLQVSHPIFLAK